MKREPVHAGLCDHICTSTLTGPLEVSQHAAAVSRRVNWSALKLGGYSNLPFGNSSLSSLTANSHPGAVWDNCWLDQDKLPLTTSFHQHPQPLSPREESMQGPAIKALGMYSKRATREKETLRLKELPVPSWTL